jgi:hypothetical protein
MTFVKSWKSASNRNVCCNSLVLKSPPPHIYIYSVTLFCLSQVLINTERYTSAVKNAISRLKNAGMTPASLKNYWGKGDGYQGINDVFYVPCDMSPTGQVKVEIQFHTPESFNHKMAVHGM